MLKKKWGMQHRLVIPMLTENDRKNDHCSVSGDMTVCIVCRERWGYPTSIGHNFVSRSRKSETDE